MISTRAKSGGRQPTGCAGRAMGVLFFGVFLAFGLGFAGFLAVESTRQLAPYFWEETPCRILESGANREAAEDGSALRLLFEFPAGATVATSTEYQVGEKKLIYSDAAVIATRYPAGAEAVCYAKPGAAPRAVLHREFPWTIYAIFFPLIFVAVGGGGIAAMFMKAKEKGSISAEARPAQSASLGIGCFSFVIIIGLIAANFLLFKPLGGMAAAAGWAAVPCEIELSRVRDHGETRSIDILYRYEIDGRTYRANRYSFLGGSDSAVEGKRRVVRSHPAGSRTVCYVNPEDPWDAVLNRSFQTKYLLGLIPVAILAFGFWGMWRSMRVGAQEPPTREDLARTAHRQPTVGEGRGRRGGKLKSSSSPLGRLIGMIFIGVFWNGIVSIFLVVCAKGWMSNDGSWLLTLFLVPFVLVGLLLIFGVAHSFLALFNPRAEVTMESATIGIGGKTKLAFKLRGNVRRIARLTIAVEGRERASYRRGTDTRTEEALFHREVILELTDPREMVFGEAEVKIPEVTMHTLDAPNNKIRWSIALHGEIERWPDVEERYEIVVEPAAGSEGAR